MSKKMVINSKNIKTRIPTVATIAWYLLLDKLAAPGWVWGAMGVLFFIAWVAAIVDVFNCEELEPLKK
jgi:hypothetical protein